MILFGIPEHKDERGSEASSPSGVVQRAIEAIRRAKLNLVVITDVCLCEYTSHGHCGVIENGEVANDPTLKLLADEALSHARAGADIVAPSDMMDGRVAAIRQALDDHGFSQLADLFLRREVLLGVLRALSGGGAIGAAIWGPAQLSDGSGKCARGHARSGARFGGGRGHHHGQAGARLISTLFGRCANALT